MIPYSYKGIFKELKNINLFNKVKVSFYSIECLNGIDIEPRNTLLVIKSIK